jgi:hypothetical protein
MLQQQLNGDTLITDATGDNTITLTGVAMSSLTSHDFQFV